MALVKVRPPININDPNEVDKFYRNVAAAISLLHDDAMRDDTHRHSELSASDGTPDRVVTVGAGGVTAIGDGGIANYCQVKADGEVNLHGTARVIIDLWLDAGGIKAPGAKPATFVELGLTGVWQFADAIAADQESISGTLKIPADMDRTYVPMFKVGWSADGVSPGNCKWQLEYLWVAPGDDTSAAAEETLTVVGAASSTSNGLIITAFSGINLPGSTDQAMFFKLTRLSGDAEDTIVDTTEMRGRLFTYVSDKLGTAT